MSDTPASRDTESPRRSAAGRILIGLGALGLLALGAEALAQAGEPSAAPAEAVSQTQTSATGVAPALATPRAPTAVSPGAALDPLPAIPSRLLEPPIGHVKSLTAEQDLLTLARRTPHGALVVGKGEATRTLTVLPALQDKLGQVLRENQTPWAAVVAIEPATGKVLAMAEYSRSAPSLRGLPVKAIFPAASVFKVITASALLDEGVKPGDEECSVGGKRNITQRQLRDPTGRGQCLSLSDALAHSANAVFARMTLKHLSPEKLLREAEAFGFNRKLDFPIPVDPSLLAVPDEPLAFAQTGAGFGDAWLSPLHGAMLATVAANGGLWREPILFEDQTPTPGDERVMSEEHAALLTEMMSGTVTDGTARKVFRERGHRIPGAVGKTGSLADKKPFRDYSWFVGFAPRDNPQVAVAAVVVNEAKWRIRATWLGREALRMGLEELELHNRKNAHSSR